MGPFARTAFATLVLVAAGCTQDFGVFEPSGGNGGSGNQGGGGTGNLGGGGTGNQGGGGTGNLGGGGTGNVGGGGSGGGCNSPGDCPDPGDCQSATCNAGACGSLQDAPGTMCGPNNSQLCDAAGACVDCLGPNDCPTPGDQCMGGLCVPDHCMNGMNDVDETGQDCGGPTCGPCPDGEMCSVAADCQSNYCPMGGVCDNCTQSTGQCAPDEHCLNATNCVPDVMLGEACNFDTWCPGNVNCEDGFCCDTACAGTCESCANVDTGQPDGQCSPSTALTDPDGECSGNGCGSGTCDGNGACGFDPVGTSCGGNTCAAGQLTSPECDAAGMCTNVLTNCNGHNCANGTTCDTDCNGQDAQCQLAFHCTGNTCAPDVIQGAACPNGNECATGLFCADGVCCDTACATLCVACTAAKKGSGADGTCGFIMTGTDPDNECSNATPNCNGSGLCL